MSEVTKRAQDIASRLGHKLIVQPVHRSNKDSQSMLKAQKLPFSPSTNHDFPAPAPKKVPQLSLDSDSLSFGIRESLTPGSSYSQSCASACSAYSTLSACSSFSISPPCGTSLSSFPSTSPSLSSSSSRSKSRSMDKFVVQPSRKKRKNQTVRFRRWAATESNRKVILVSKGLVSGKHEFSLKILKCDVEKQEIGVISNGDIDGTPIRDGGVSATNFGARSVYGNEMETDSIYYGTWNDDGTRRCFRDLSSLEPSRNWCTGDVIKVCVDLDRFRIKYVLNGVRVKKTMSLQKKKKYYPMICFSGNCQYKLL